PDATVDEFHTGGDHARRITRWGEVFVDAGNAGLRGAEQGTLARRSAGAKDHVGVLADECPCLAGAPGRVGIRRVPARLVGAEHPNTRSDVARPALEALPVASIHRPAAAIDAAHCTRPLPA